ncbi:MAG: hypothetical protein AABZ08_01485 [Planctomycetota bacterium]
MSRRSWIANGGDQIASGELCRELQFYRAMDMDEELDEQRAELNAVKNAGQKEAM